MNKPADIETQHILVIDDDERLRLLLRRFLEESGFRVTDVGSAGDARQLLESIAFDMMIVDIMMPGETGLEFLTDLRKDSQVPALFLTAMSETEHRITGLETGADDYMSKPFEPRELVLRIRSILARAAARPRTADPYPLRRAEASRQLRLATGHRPVPRGHRHRHGQHHARQVDRCGCRPPSRKNRARSAVSCLSPDRAKQGLASSHGQPGRGHECSFGTIFRRPCSGACCQLSWCR